MSLVLTRNQFLRQHWRLLRKRDPESSPIWEKSFLPKTLRSPKLYGWYHNSPYAQWNNYSYFALEKRTLRESVAQLCFKRPETSRFAELLKLAEISVLREISDQGPYTVFAPSNAALSRLPGGWESSFAHFQASPASLRKFLRMHIVRGNRRVRSARTLQTSDPYVNLEGKKLTFTLETKRVDEDLRKLRYTVRLAGSSLEHAEIADYDFRTHNGYVSVINGLLGFAKADLKAREDTRVGATGKGALKSKPLKGGLNVKKRGAKSKMAARSPRTNLA